MSSFHFTPATCTPALIARYGEQESVEASKTCPFLLRGHRVGLEFGISKIAR